MYGFLLTAKKINLHNIAQNLQIRMLPVSISIGILSGFFISIARLNLGMPGHKAFFWMTPLLIHRLLRGCKIGISAGSLFAAITTYSLGANLAGGVLGMPIIVVAGMTLDLAVNFVEKNKFSNLMTILILGFAGMFANLICLTKRMILPSGVNIHFIFSVSGFWFVMCSYAFFGFISGFSAFSIMKLIIYKQRNNHRTE